MKKIDIVNFGKELNKKGVKNSKKVLNNYLYFLAKNEIKVKDIVRKTGHTDILYSTRTGKKVYTLSLDISFLKSNDVLVSVN